MAAAALHDVQLLSGCAISQDQIRLQHDAMPQLMPLLLFRGKQPGTLFSMLHIKSCRGMLKLHLAISHASLLASQCRCASGWTEGNRLTWSCAKLGQQVAVNLL